MKILKQELFTTANVLAPSTLQEIEMRHNSFRLLILFLLALTAACSPARPQEEMPPPAPVVEPTAAPMDMGMPVPSTDVGPDTAPTEMVVTGIITHTDGTNGYTFDYPSSWMLDAVVFGSRAPGGYQLTSWAHEPGMVSEVPPDGTIMNILVQLWEPKADLAAFVENRKMAWDASGIQIVSEETVVLANGQPAVEIVTQSQDSQTSYLLLSTLGENYLVASGNGDIELIRQVARSLR